MFLIGLQAIADFARVTQFADRLKDGASLPKPERPVRAPVHRLAVVELEENLLSARQRCRLRPS